MDFLSLARGNRCSGRPAVILYCYARPLATVFKGVALAFMKSVVRP